jgi:hypothetical protein
MTIYFLKGNVLLCKIWNCQFLRYISGMVIYVVLSNDKAISISANHYYSWKLNLVYKQYLIYFCESVSLSSERYSKIIRILAITVPDKSRLVVGKKIEKRIISTNVSTNE